jgi:S1-C subfamily serine protease
LPSVPNQDRAVSRRLGSPSSTPVSSGKGAPPWFGVQVQLVVPALKDLLRVPLVNGLLVEVVDPGSPAEKAGIEGGDLEIAINGLPVLLGGDIIT